MVKNLSENIFSNSAFLLSFLVVIMQYVENTFSDCPALPLIAVINPALIYSSKKRVISAIISCGILFAVAFYAFGFSYELLIALGIVCLLMIVVVSDITYLIIPDEVLLFFTFYFIIIQILNIIYQLVQMNGKMVFVIKQWVKNVKLVNIEKISHYRKKLSISICMETVQLVFIHS